MEGRDIGTAVFSGCGGEDFLDAAPGVRGNRRYKQVGPAVAAVTEGIACCGRCGGRDARDRSRVESPAEAGGGCGGAGFDGADSGRGVAAGGGDCAGPHRCPGVGRRGESALKTVQFLLRNLKDFCGILAGYANLCVPFE